MESKSTKFEPTAKPKTDANTVLCAVADGDVIGFRYKGNRFVKGKIVGTYPTGFLIELKTDYIGKNDEWFIGEKKFFNRKEMKKVSRQ